MSIRLSKAIKECNVGLQTAVDFLNKKGIGEVEANLNAKISDEQYDLLLKEFKPDSVLKDAANHMLQQQKEEKERKEKEKAEAKAKAKAEAEAKAKAEEEAKAKAEEEAKAKKQALKVVGHIDLDAPKKKAEPAAEEKKQAEKPAEAPVAKPAEEAKPAANEPQIITDGKVTGTLENGVFRLNAPQQPSSGLKVQGHIDLSALNQSTRPKKKSKDERKREREEKQQQAQADRKKQRMRGGKEKVDVNAVVSQQKQQGQGKNQQGQGNKNNNAANQQQGQGKKAKNKQKNQPKQQPQPVEVSEEEVAKQVRETLARLTAKGSKMGKGAKYRREKREAFREQMEEEMMNEMAENKVLKLTEFVTANELATMMNVPVTSIIGTCMSIGIMVSINQRLDAETINIVAEEYGFKTEYVSAEVSEAVIEEEDDESDLVPRAPIVTVMGHVDHGKTSLLDYIRQANVIAGEAGGITQHIGAYNVTLKDGRHVTFLDTPGHEAFTAMRARGAQVTDIAIIIIAADDSIMPQTKEAIAHATAANVPIVFAINKIDKPTANPEKIKEGLAAMNFLVEDWGGKYQSQDISAKAGIGVEELLEKVLLEAEMLDLKANPNRKATGSIIESSLDKGRGYVATVLVSNGTLRVGDVMLAGTNYGRVKAMFDERGRRINEIGPSQAATILGLNGAPTAGDTFHIMENDQEAREIANKREQLAREQGLRTMKRVDLTEIGRRIALGDFQELNLLVMGDVDGSIEALKDSFERLSTEKIKVNVIYKAVGQISESDVTLAAASDAIIIAFQVRPSAQARRLAEQEGVDIRQYSVIYDAIEEVKDAMEGMLSPEIKEEITAQVEVRQVYHISKVGTVAGAYVIDGKVSRTNKARVIRDGIVVYTGEINALKRFKDDVKEVTTNFECGISLVNYNDLREGDILETFAEIEIKAKL